MDDEKLKMANEIAAKITDQILELCDPEAQGVVISLVMKNIHTNHRIKIEESQQKHLSTTTDYTAFLESINLPEVKDVENG